MPDNPVNTIDPTGQFGLSDITNFLADAARTVGSIIEGAVNMVYDAVNSTVDYVTHRTRGFVSEVLPGITSDMLAILGRAGPALDEYLGRTPRLASSLPSDYLGEASASLFGIDWDGAWNNVVQFGKTVGEGAADVGRALWTMHPITLAITAAWAGGKLIFTGDAWPSGLCGNGPGQQAGAGDDRDSLSELDQACYDHDYCIGEQGPILNVATCKVE